MRCVRSPTCSRISRAWTSTRRPRSSRATDVPRSRRAPGRGGRVARRRTVRRRRCVRVARRHAPSGYGARDMTPPMEVLHGADARPSDDRPTVATVGMFDGVHRGHRLLFDRVFADAQELDARVGRRDVRPAPAGGPRAGQGAVHAHDAGAALAPVRGGRVRRGARPAVQPRARRAHARAVREGRARGRAQRRQDPRRRGLPLRTRPRRRHRHAATRSDVRTASKPRRSRCSATTSHKIGSSAIRRLVADGKVEEAAALLGHNFRLARHGRRRRQART